MWQPIAGTETSRRCWDAIDAIAAGLLESNASGAGTRHPSLFASGKVGQSLFFSYLEAARPGNGAGDHAFSLLEEGIDALSGATLYPDLYSGFCGIGWLVEHLSEFLFEADDELTAEIEATLRERLTSAPGTSRPRPYELISGLAGLGVYLLERHPHADVGDLVSRILDLLEEASEEGADGRTWHSRPEWLSDIFRERFPEGGYNLGVAHGIPGVLGFLAAARHAGIADPRVAELAEGTVAWLLGQRMPEGGDTRFSAIVAPGVPPEPTRSAWCYGDPGIAAVLLSSARAFDRPDWEAEALALARLVAKRPAEATEATDSCLCHGTAGLGHLFNRMYQATGDPEMKEAALAWFARTLELRKPGQGLAGFLNWTADERGVSGWRGEAGFLSGIAGTGLALLAAVTDQEPAWDRVLAVAVPPR